ncbi:M20 family metallopeptidase [Microbacterium sp. lyk4-40-TSB-66]|uniref:M20 metallopeptidase family protein n=1 Tax=Microbacterium sp. lyk4-40-TSB-66 TaxID=3040294 RepID=UPI00254D231B|nr:M20 family metallopeptidase [Microbacterium sp. lyk4-40-TSB-66]
MKVAVDEVEVLTADLVAVRRELHALAEVGLDLPETQALLLRELAGLGLEITTGTALSSVTAVLRGALPGPSVLLRADMDALPVVEATGLPFASSRGTMHACGHDLHMAGLLGAARILAGRRDELAGCVVFMFQPGEEGYAGARSMIDEGVLDAAGAPPVAAFALHVDTMTDGGTFVTRPGPMMAGVSAATLTVRGTGGHAAMPHQGIDPVPVAAELVLAVQSYAARRLPVTDPAVLSVTGLRSDSAAGNVLSETVTLVLNMRTFSDATRSRVRDDLPALLTGIARAHGCDLETQWVDSYPVTVNDPDETAAVLDMLRAAHGVERVRVLDAPSPASEDFAYVLERVPGTLVFLGVAPAGQRAPLHSDRAVFDDSHLGLHAATLAELAWERLHRTGP